MLIQIDKSPVKNPIWEYYTPNELYESDILSYGKLGMSYLDFLSAWKKMNQVRGKPDFFEVRIVDGKTQEKIHDSRAWWRQPEFMDKIFWVWQRPEALMVGDDRYFVYMLEPLEAARVVETAKERLGHNPFESDMPALYVPVECCVLAWTETSNGYSDHGRHRPEHVPTQQEVDENALAEIRADQLLGEAIDIVDPEIAEKIAGPMGGKKGA